MPDRAGQSWTLRPYCAPTVGHTDGQRLKAARALAGIGSQLALARELNLDGFGDRTIREVELDKRKLKPHEREAVARLVGVSPYFFTLDLERLGPENEAGALTPETARELLAELARLARGPDRGEGPSSPGQSGTGRQDQGA